jgi:hypothetical protein
MTNIVYLLLRKEMNENPNFWLDLHPLKTLAAKKSKNGSVSLRLDYHELKLDQWQGVTFHPGGLYYKTFSCGNKY